jgi:hypothetical protein
MSQSEILGCRRPRSRQVKKLPRLLIILLLGLFGFIISPVGIPGDQSSGVRSERFDRTIFRSGLIKAKQTLVDRLETAPFYQIDLEIPDGFSPLKGRELVRYINRSDGPLSDISLCLYHNAMIHCKCVLNSVKVNGAVVQPMSERNGAVAKLSLPKPIEPGKEAILDIEFEMNIRVEREGEYYLIIGYISRMLVLPVFYPVIPVHDQTGWNTAPLQMWGDETFHDAAFYVVRVVAPSSLTLVGSGIPVKAERQGDRQVVTFALGPARDFYLAAATDLAVASAKVGETTAKSYAFTERKEGAQKALGYALKALEVFGNLFGPYPYTEFDLISVPMLTGAMEYSGLVGVAFAEYGPEKETKLEYVIVHEVAHQWFYNIVGSDQVDEPWLDEALAQFATLLYFRDVHGPEAAKEILNSWHGLWDEGLRATIPIGRPSSSYRTAKVYKAIVYGRGPLFLAALEERMGREKFAAFLADYVRTNEWKIATTASFKDLAEQHCRCDLTPLFEEWVSLPSKPPSPSGGGGIYR